MITSTVHKGGRLVIELDSWHDIFRFTVNMTEAQVEFAAEAHVILVEMAEAIGYDRFTPLAKSLLGEERYRRLASAGYFNRDTYCISCERDLAPMDLRRKLPRARIACEGCASNDLEAVSVVTLAPVGGVL